MTDSRREFLRRFATSAMAVGSAGAVGLTVGCVVYGPPPATEHQGETRVLEDFYVNVGSRLHFDADSIAVRGDAKAVLDRQVAWLTEHPAFNVVLEGHTDDRGSREYLLPVSERMAGTVKSYMVAHGIAPQRITVLGYGKERPDAQGDREAARARNRRVEVKPQISAPSSKM
ncbi:Outer membrane lipoprotein omp16 (Peptidoglycan-associated lipoprotein) [Candidatus Terasakiella magnetica]|nr:Outer membrane lipoprotein omp16 (Peptidoglycan-associated lipoprotein) [Candidatus Terasakiella magnetica]